VKYLGLENASEVLSPEEPRPDSVEVTAETEPEPAPRSEPDMPMETEEEVQRRERLMRMIEYPMPDQLVAPPQPPVEDHPPLPPSPPRIPMPPDDTMSFKSYATKITARLEDVLATSPFTATLKTPSAVGSHTTSPCSGSDGGGYARASSAGDPDAPIGPDVDDAMRMFGDAPGTCLPNPPTPFTKSSRLLALEAELAAKSPRIGPLEVELVARAAAPRWVKSPRMEALERELEVMGVPSGTLKRDLSRDRGLYGRYASGPTSPAFNASPAYSPLAYPASPDYSDFNQNINPASPGWGADPALVGDSAKAQRGKPWGADAGPRKTSSLTTENIAEDVKKDTAAVQEAKQDGVAVTSGSKAPSRAPSSLGTPKSRETTVQAGLPNDVGIQASPPLPAAGTDHEGRSVPNVVQRAREAALAEKAIAEKEAGEKEAKEKEAKEKETREKEMKEGEAREKEAAEREVVSDVVQQAQEAALAEKEEDEARRREAKAAKAAAMAQGVVNSIRRSALKSRDKQKAFSGLGKTTSTSTASPTSVNLPPPAASANTKTTTATATTVTTSTADTKTGWTATSSSATTAVPLKSVLTRSSTSSAKSSLSTKPVPTVLKSAIKKGTSPTKAQNTVCTSTETAIATEPAKRPTGASISRKINDLVQPVRYSHHHVETGWGSPLMGC
jgi:hypothetical protein